MEDDRMAAVQRIMLDFAEQTGVRGGGVPRRYLWTDAFAVCNYLELYRRSAEERWRDLAVLLVDQVHHVLGRHRPDSGRGGWISGLSEKEGERRPTAGGLRIGKLLDERRPHDPPDERLEWERDGQYYHYLTKWMHALNRMAHSTGDGAYLRWGAELAQAAHAGFSHASPRGGKVLYWKMSIDLSRPLVPSMGAHDPLDGLVTCLELQSRGRALQVPDAPDLSTAIEELSALCRDRGWDTDDLLGIGGLLCDAWRIRQLMEKGVWEDRKVPAQVLRAALRGIAMARGMLDLPNSYRLPFRELGFSIGIHAAERLEARRGGLFGEGGERDAARLALYRPLAEKVEGHWLSERNQQAQTWLEHGEINPVMLATTLAPEEFLTV